MKNLRAVCGLRWTVYIAFLCCIVFGVLSFFSLFASGDSDTAGNVDEVLKKVGELYIRRTIENTDTIDEAASRVGIESDELMRICIALDISAPFTVPREPVIEPVPISTAGLLEDNEYEPACLVRFRGIDPHVILVDKSTYTLYLLEYREGNRTVIDSFPCKTGRNHGDKIREGDQRTPEGVFFFVNRYDRDDIRSMVGRENEYLYGDMAFATDFPNTIDQIQGKNGGGIWLHGTDRNFEEMSPNDTRGCVVTTNATINSLSGYISLRETPIVIVESIDMVKKDTIERSAREIMENIENWRDAWANEDIERYGIHYAGGFTSQGMDRNHWLSRKKNIFDAYSIDHIQLDHVSIFRHNEGLIIRFVQDYAASNTAGTGVKILYMMRDNGNWGIVTEKFRRL